jgi:Uma2 family endonuclease
MTTVQVTTMEALATGRIDYPERDGKPMGETDFHISVILYLRQALDYHFRNAHDMYVAANMFLYYEKGNPTAVVCPDAFVVRGVEKKKRRTFKLWEEKVAPCAVIEVTSRSSRIEDLGTKRAVYELLGVREYFLFDPLDEHLKPALQGFRLAGQQYRKLAPSKSGILRSKELGLILHPQGNFLRLVDATTGEFLPDLSEAMNRAAAEQERAAAAAKRAETEAKRAETEATRAETEARRAETEAQAAKAERARAERAEREVARLRARIAKISKKP